MTRIPDSLANVDWSITTFEGNRREQLRRWAELPFENVLAALEEMEDIARALGSLPEQARRPSSEP